VDGGCGEVEGEEAYGCEGDSGVQVGGGCQGEEGFGGEVVGPVGEVAVEWGEAEEPGGSAEAGVAGGWWGRCCAGGEVAGAGEEAGGDVAEGGELVEAVAALLYEGGGWVLELVEVEVEGARL